MLALAVACFLAVLMGIRPLASVDLGYHLRYGYEGITDTNPYIFTLPRVDLPPARRPPPGPGCWYDRQGRYRFPNANWGTQVLLAGVHRLAGFGGLNRLLTLLVCAVTGLVVVAMLRQGVPPAWAAAGVILFLLTAYERFSLRPELFGYVLLLAQFCVLSARRMTRASAAALIVLQLLLVNMHGYFLLGIMLTGIFLADRALRVLWDRARDRGPADQTARYARELRILAVVFVGQIGVAFINPWTWRGAVLPIQTLRFLREHGITTTAPASSGHPWAHISEVFKPFAPGAFLDRKATYAYCVVLGLGGLGALAAVCKRRWASAAVILMMAAVSLSMRRNIALGALLIVPAAVGSLWSFARKAVETRRALRRPALRIAAGAAVAAAAAYLCFSVATNRFYFAERSPIRFAAGISRLTFPLDAAEWANRNLLPPDEGAADWSENVWVDHTCSSNFHFLRWRSVPGTRVSALSNTWAYPPDTMRQVVDVCRGAVPFETVTRKYPIDVVVLRVDSTSTALAKSLLADPQWKLVHLDALHAVFLPIESRYPAGNAAASITSQSLDVAAHIEKLRGMDPIGAHALHTGGITLFRLEWDSAAVAVFRAVVNDRPDYHEAWNLLGVSLVRRGTQRLRARHPGGRGDLEEARRSFEGALRVQRGYAPAETNLESVHKLLADLRKGILP